MEELCDSMYWIDLNAYDDNCNYDNDYDDNSYDNSYDDNCNYRDIKMKDINDIEKNK